MNCWSEWNIWDPSTCHIVTHCHCGLHALKARLAQKRPCSPIELCIRVDLHFWEYSTDAANNDKAIGVGVRWCWTSPKFSGLLLMPSYKIVSPTKKQTKAFQLPLTPVLASLSSQVEQLARIIDHHSLKNPAKNSTSYGLPENGILA